MPISFPQFFDLIREVAVLERNAERGREPVNAIRKNRGETDFFEADAQDAKKLASARRKLLFNNDGTPTPRSKSILGHTPMGRFGESSELISALVCLARPRPSRFVTRIDLRVSGGFLSQTI